MLLSDEDAVADAQVFDHVAHCLHVEAYLEVAAAMLLRRLLVFIRYDKVVNNALDCGRFLIQVILVHFDTLLAAEVDTTVT